ncbi:MAG: hypothetical protein IIU28_02570 [Lachnospiraceae bacterium]|nr:hypothetical protein [Lachnospiraceae bacterium]
MKKKVKDVLITDDGVVDNAQIRRTRIFVAVCAVIGLCLILLGIGALTYDYWR